MPIMIFSPVYFFSGHTLQVQYIKIPSSEHVENMLWTQIVSTFRTIYVHNMFSTCSELGIFMYWTGKFNYGLANSTRISTSEKDLTVSFEITGFK